MDDTMKFTKQFFNCINQLGKNGSCTVDMAHGTRHVLHEHILTRIDRVTVV